MVDQMSVEEYKYWDLSDKLISAAIEVHKILGPGFIESVYHNAMENEMELQDIPFETEKTIRIFYKNEEVGLHRVDLLIDNKIVIELKAVYDISDIHVSQVISYLKATKLNVGLIINFSKNKIDIQRIVKE
jgi:GxxExxY protein